MATTDDLGDRPLVPAAAAGVAAWVLGYLFTYVLVGSDVRDSGLNRFVEAVEGEPATYELVGWIFYNAHLVDVVYEGLGGMFMPANVVRGSDDFTPLLFALPPLLLLGAGLAVGRYRGAVEADDGGITGATVVLGYLPLAVFGSFLFEVSAAGTSGRPDLLGALVLAGVVYPVFFGAAGGVLAAITAEEGGGEAREERTTGPGS